MSPLPSQSLLSRGAAMMAIDDAQGAEAAFRRDLEFYPRNGWSMFGLIQSLRAQGKNKQTAEVHVHF